MALVGDGKVLVAGKEGIMALLPSGQVDASFGTEGVAMPSIPSQFVVGPESLGLSAIAVDRQGRAVVAGDFLPESPAVTHPLVERFSSTGQVEEEFSPEVPAKADLQQISFDSAGRIVIKGRTPRGSVEKDFLARLEESGQADPSFGDAGLRLLPDVPHWYDETKLERSWAIGPGDGISVALEGGSGQSLLQLSCDGARAKAFGHGGVVPYPRGTILGPLVDPHGRLITWSEIEGVEHRLPNGIRIDRLTPRGRPDRSFGRHGSIELRIPHLYTAELALEEDGNILVAALLKGRGAIAEGKELALYRLRDDGRIDRSFGHGGMVRISFPHVAYPLLNLEEVDVRGIEATLLATDCGRNCEPVVAKVDLGN